MVKTKNHKLRQEFLEGFVNELILLSKSDKQVIIEKHPTPFELPSPTPIRRMPPQRPQRLRSRISGRRINPQMMNAPIARKISALLSDPYVNSIECPGPDKPIIINRSGEKQTSQITLSKEEIDDLMHEFSEQSRIPLVSGVFKALIGNLLVIAAISEFVGTRFILQKRKSHPIRYRRNI